MGSACSRPPFFTATGGTWRLASSPGPNSASDQPGFPFPSSPATTHPTHSSPGMTHRRHATSPTHRLHGRGHVVVSLRLLGQAGSLQQLLSVPHSRFRGGCWAGHSTPLREREEGEGGDLRLGTRGWCERGTSTEPPPPRALRTAGLPPGSPQAPLRVPSAAAHPPAARAGRRLAPRAHRGGKAGKPRARSVPCAAPAGSRLSARLGASRCCRRLRLRARKATRGRSRGDCRGGEGALLPRVLFLGDVTCYK